MKYSQSINMRNYYLGNASILALRKTPWMQAGSPGTSVLHQPTSFHLQTAVPNGKLLEKFGSAWKAMDDHSEGGGKNTYICLSSYPVWRPWKGVRRVGDLLPLFSLEFHVQVNVSHQVSKWQLTPVFLPGNPHGQRSLAGYRPWGHKESDMTEWLSTAQYMHTYMNIFVYVWL